MNYFPNPYFPLFYQQPYLENQVSPSPESSHEEESQRYIRILESQNQLLKGKVQSLEQKLKNYEELENGSQIIMPKKRKNINKDQKFECEYSNCKRSYKSTLALNLHIKMKHNGGSIRERQAYAVQIDLKQKLILECQRDNKPKPDININFPPNFLENYRQKILAAQKIAKQTST